MDPDNINSSELLLKEILDVWMSLSVVYPEIGSRQNKALFIPKNAWIPVSVICSWHKIPGQRILKEERVYLGS